MIVFASLYRPFDNNQRGDSNVILQPTVIKHKTHEVWTTVTSISNPLKFFSLVQHFFKIKLLIPGLLKFTQILILNIHCERKKLEEQLFATRFHIFWKYL